MLLTHHCIGTFGFGSKYTFGVCSHLDSGPGEGAGVIGGGEGNGVYGSGVGVAGRTNLEARGVVLLGGVARPFCGCKPITIVIITDITNSTIPASNAIRSNF